MRLQHSDRRYRYFFCGEIKFGSSVEVLVYQSRKKGYVQGEHTLY